MTRRAEFLLLAALGSFLPCLPAAEATPGAFVRGFVQTGDASGIWTLRRCGETIDVPLKDETPADALTVAVAEIKRGMQDPRRAVFVEFQGDATRERAVAKRLWRVLGYVAECSKAPTNIVAGANLWAGGNEPSWNLIERHKVATLTRLGNAPLKLLAAPKPTTVRRRYEAEIGSARVTVEVTEEICLDTMAEAAYGARITATVQDKKGDTQTLRGCAARF